MEPIAVTVVVIALLVAVVILGLRRRPRQDDGMQTFRRHIDALSPEARREVMDRARRHEDRTRPIAGPGVSGIHGLGPMSSASPASPASPDADDTDREPGSAGADGGN